MRLKKYLSTQEVSEEYGIGKSTLEQMRCRGEGPAYIKVSARMVKYTRADIEAWLDSHRKATIDSGPPEPLRAISG